MTTGDNWGSTLHRVSIKMFEYLRDEPVVTVKDRHRPARHREQPGRHREQPGRHRCSTEAHTDPGRATARPRLSPVVPRWSPGECRQSPGIARFIGKPALCRDATGIHQGSAWS
ncbi:hypothetical protein DPMN_173696 [Dreissena polymorpha]|uniref:Uncharacterized protein n=1 Tax=Dreissena polymorpha TaxID=45954 RepID=A0A9D4E224_DREPO|nr:hypothetical protein DPMN_173696 [Dreissena polymorpha]